MGIQKLVAFSVVALVAMITTFNTSTANAGASNSEECISAADCNDGNPCTKDMCPRGNSPKFCVHQEIPNCTLGLFCVKDPACKVNADCNDGNACTKDYCGFTGKCGHFIMECNDDIECTVDSCSTNGCEHKPDASSCDDGMTCSDSLGCVECVDNFDCDDGDPCTVEECNTIGSCIVEPLCDEGFGCTIESKGYKIEQGHCVPKVGSGCSTDMDCGASVTFECDSNKALYSVLPFCFEGKCETMFGSFVEFCDDGNPCTEDVCDDTPMQGAVGPGCSNSLSVCDDANPCTTDSCDPSTGCAYTNNTDACNDGNACTNNDACLNGACNAGSPSICDDANPCTTDSCDTATGCKNNPISGCISCLTVTDCDDGDPCSSETCASGVCVYAEIIGCTKCTSNLNCNDGNACTTNLCMGGVCNFEPVAGCTPCITALDCNDNDPCTNDSCLGDGLCIHTEPTSYQQFALKEGCKWIVWDNGSGGFDGVVECSTGTGKVYSPTGQTSPDGFCNNVQENTSVFASSMTPGLCGWPVTCKDGAPEYGLTP